MVQIFWYYNWKTFLSYISKKSPLETPRNIRTEKSIKIIDENLDFDYEKKLLIDQLNKLHKIKGQTNHPIYGVMKSEKILFLIKHHTIHHLNQFNLIKVTLNWGWKNHSTVTDFAKFLG